MAPISWLANLSQSAESFLRKAATKLVLWQQKIFVNEMESVHHMELDSYEEDHFIFISSLVDLSIFTTFGLSSMVNWMLDSDILWAYKEFKTFLQADLMDRDAHDNFIDGGNSSEHRLVLKSPDHLWFLDDLLEVFPEATVVWMHRDPSQSIASFCALSSVVQDMIHADIHESEESWDSHKMCQEIKYIYLAGVQRAMALRDKIEQNGVPHFYDVHFDDLSEDPSKVVMKFMDAFPGLLNIAGEDIRQFLEEELKQPDAKGNNEYKDVDAYGLDEGKIHKDFEEYMTRYNISSASYTHGMYIQYDK